MDTEKPDPREPGSFRRAFFQAVPHGLDSLWRWTEFRTNRLGRVNFDSPNAFNPRPAWKCGAFVLFAIMSWFAVFGPTPDALCSLAGFEVANRARIIVGAILFVVGALVLARAFDWATVHLARQAEEKAEKNRKAKPARPEAPLSPNLNRANRIANAIKHTMTGHEEARFDNLAVFFRAMPDVSPRDRRPLYLTLIILGLGSILAAAPFFLAGYASLTVDPDPMSCARMQNGVPALAQFIVIALVLIGGFFIWRKLGVARHFNLFLASTLLLGAGIGVLWLFFTPQFYSEAKGGFYPHVYLILIGSLMAIVLIARWLCDLLFARFESRQTFRDGLKSENLLYLRRDLPDVSALRLCSAFINGVTSNLLHFLLLPAFVVFIAPTQYMWLGFWVFLGVSAILLMYGSLSSRWAQMLVYVQRWFLVGTPLVLSVAVILIAALRLKDVQYVSTVLDATPMGVLFIIVMMMYVAFWLFEFWINRWVGEKLLSVLSDEPSSCHGYVSCPYVEAPPDPALPKDELPAKANGRYVALHGTGRFVAQGWFERETPGPRQSRQDHSFATFAFVELFSVLGARQKGGPELAKEIHRRVHLYFTIVNFALLGAAVLLIKWHLNWSLPLAVEPMVNAVTIKPEEVSDATLRAKSIAEGDVLGQRLIAQGNHGDASTARPSIVVAASGGGTRAAVYTAVALEGLAQIDRARDVVLLSGVSGGGVSAAVFASRFKSLRSANPRAESADHSGPWSQYVNAVSQPFIQDVLEGVGELRIAGSWSLGSLLQESLERRAFGPGTTDIVTFGKLADPALILNSAISGHPYEDSVLLQGRVAPPKAGGNCTEQSRPYANLAGGRLIFTNLANLTGFPERSTQVPDLWLPYRIVTDGTIKLASASALTANFPPVFSNARVRLRNTEKDVCARSYFVTDGGATENLGLVSALYALRGTLTQLDSAAKLADIHVLALEASAIDYDYRDDRGVGAATGGSKERINAGLTQVLLKEVEGLVAQHGARLRVHYLPLPVAFRSRGGFGTHWMFARNILVSNPLLAKEPESKDQVSLTREEVMVTLRALFDPNEPICDRAQTFQADIKSAPPAWTPDVQRVARWICGRDARREKLELKPDYQVEAWATVVQDLGTQKNSAAFEPYLNKAEAP